MNHRYRSSGVKKSHSLQDMIPERHIDAERRSTLRLTATSHAAGCGPEIHDRDLVKKGKLKIIFQPGESACTARCA